MEHKFKIGDIVVQTDASLITWNREKNKKEEEYQIIAKSYTYNSTLVNASRVPIIKIWELHSKSAAYWQYERDYELKKDKVLETKIYEDKRYSDVFE